MALNVGRWVKYARASLDRTVGQGNRDLDRLEAEREVELADKPWLRSDGTAPTLDETRARIEWEAARQREEADRRAGRPADTEAERDRDGDGDGSDRASSPDDARTGEEPQAGAESIDPPTRPGPGAGRNPGLPAASDPIRDTAADAEAARARIELDARQQEATARLEAIRRELGVDEPAPDAPEDPPSTP